MVKKLIIFGECGVVKKRLDEVKELRGPVTGKAYLWHKPGAAVKMDQRDHDALFVEEIKKPARASKKNEEEVKDA